MGGPPHGSGHSSHTSGPAARAAVTVCCASRSDDGGPVPPSTRPPSSSTTTGHRQRRPIMAQPTLIPNCDGARFESLPLDAPRNRVEQTYAAPQGPRFCTTLALVLGTSTGWAIRGHDGLITSGTVSLRPGRFDGGGMRYLRFTTWLTEIDRLSGPVAAIWF